MWLRRVPAVWGVAASVPACRDSFLSCSEPLAHRISLPAPDRREHQSANLPGLGLPGDELRKGHDKFRLLPDPPPAVEEFLIPTSGYDSNPFLRGSRGLTLIGNLV